MLARPIKRGRQSSVGIEILPNSACRSIGRRQDCPDGLNEIGRSIGDLGLTHQKETLKRVQPRTPFIPPVAATFLAGCGVWYVWEFFVKPFRAGLKG
jgi:hypothetical protein